MPDYLPTPARHALICVLAAVGFVVGPFVDVWLWWRNRRRCCNLGSGWHVHFPDEGGARMTPQQREAARESIHKARREVRDG